jgi:hypothetical protein
MSIKKQNPEVSKDVSLTPSTLKLNQLRAGKGPGMLTEEEIQLLRQSKKEISEVCQKIYQFKK